MPGRIRSRTTSAETSIFLHCMVAPIAAGPKDRQDGNLVFSAALNHSNQSLITIDPFPPIAVELFDGFGHIRSGNGDAGHVGIAGQGRIDGGRFGGNAFQVAHFGAGSAGQRGEKALSRMASGRA